MRAATAVGAALVAVCSIACGGDGGGTTDPDVVPQVAGRWEGAQTTAPNSCPQGQEAGTQPAVFAIQQQSDAVVIHYSSYRASGRVTAAGGVSASGRETFPDGHYEDFSFSGQFDGDRLTGSGAITETACGLNCPPTPCTTNHTFDLTRDP